MRGSYVLFKDAAATLIAVVLVLCTGCGGDQTASQGPEDNAAPSAKPRVALIMKSLANEFFLTMEEGARAHQKENADATNSSPRGSRTNATSIDRSSLSNR